MSIELPRDAEGREIPLDTTVLFDKDGKEIEVSRYQYYPKVGPGYWNIRSVRNKYYRMDEVHLTPPDSWEKLEEDLRRAIEAKNESDSPVCSYTNHLDDLCDDCKFHGGGFNCKDKMLADIASRIRKLRGADE